MYYCTIVKGGPEKISELDSKPRIVISLEVSPVHLVYINIKYLPRIPLNLIFVIIEAGAGARRGAGAGSSRLITPD